MSTYLYDKAMLDKLKKWGVSDNATLLAPDDTQTLYDIINSRSNDGGIELPLITLNRKGNVNIRNTNKQPLSINAYTMVRSKTNSAILNAIPIELSYQLDIYTRKRIQAEEYVRELTFNFINYPEIMICVPYENLNYWHKSMISLNNEVQDNSAIPERLIHGQFTRYTMSLKVDDAYLFDVRIRDTVQKVEWTTYSDQNVDGESMIVEAKKND